MDNQPNWSPQFNAFLSSPLGKEMVRELTVVHDGLVKKAEGADSSERAFGLLKEASGVTIALGHLRFLAVLPKDEGGKDTK